MIIKNKEVTLEDLGNGIQRKILSHDGKMMCVEVHFKKGAIGAVHSHPHEQISYILKGSFKYTYKDKDTILKEGDTYYVEPDAAHGVVALEEDSIILDIFTPQREDFLK
jgi:quercetin dioxygenase-like cupin family protein